MLKEARSKFSELEFIEADIRELDFEQFSFYGVLSSFSLIHLPKKDVESAISNFSKILKSKGLLFIGLQAGEPEEVTVEQPLNPKDEIFLNIMSENEIKEILNEEGFSVVEKFEREPEPCEFEYTKLVMIAKKN